MDIVLLKTNANSLSEERAKNIKSEIFAVLKKQLKDKY
jgi:hypothetical protein